MTDFAPYINISTRMLNNDKDRDKAFDGYANMYHLLYDLPENLESVEWIRKYISPDPHDAIAASIRVLSSLWPRINKQPMAPGAKNKQRANEEEMVLDWNLHNLSKLRGRSIVSDINESSLLYGCAFVYVNDIENEIMLREAHGQDVGRLKIARRKSRFYANVYNPKNVHVRSSSYGVEDILLCQERPIYEILAERPDDMKRYSSTEDIADSDYLHLVSANDNTMVRYFDYWNHTTRAIWCIPAEDNEHPFWIMKPEDHMLSFLPWVVELGASDLEYQAEHKFHPMLYPLHFSGSWHYHNDVKSVAYSEALARSGAPRFKEEGPNRANTRVNYFNPARIAKVPTGNTLMELNPSILDPALMEMDDRIGTDLQKATVSRLLQGGDLPSGTAYATLNLATQTAIGALKPAKEIAENALGQICEIMLLWTAETAIPLDGYEMIDSNEMGAQYSILPEKIDPSAIYITVELTPDIPSDQLRRANTAQMLVNLGYPRARALRDVGVNDPEKAMEEAYMEQLIDFKFKTALDMQAQSQMMMLQNMAQQQQMQQMQEMPPRGGMEGGPMPGPIPSGQGFNPALAGESPVPYAPEEEVLREMVQGQDFTGAGIMPPEML